MLLANIVDAVSTGRDAVAGKPAAGMASPTTSGGGAPSLLALLEPARVSIVNG